MNAAGLALFAVCYAMLSARRLAGRGLDRPTIALLGATLMVAFGVLTPAGALASIDANTLLLLFGLMGVGAAIAEDGLFAWAEARMVAVARTPARLVGAVLWGSGLAAALLTNDAVCLLAAPPLIRLVQRHRLPAAPFLLALATGANTGSAATLLGNPQNMLCASLGDLNYLDHLRLAGPVALLGLAVNHAVLAASFRGVLTQEPLQVELSAAPRRWRVHALVLVGLVMAVSLGADLAWSSAGAFVAVVIARGQDVRTLYPRIDFSLLLFFAGLFTLVSGFHVSGGPAWLFAHAPLTLASDDLPGWSVLAAKLLVGSNLVSNVPFILIVRDAMNALPTPTRGWELLAMASTFAGNLTLFGSVANLIVAEAARDVGGLGFWQHLRVGAPVALLTTALAVVGVVWAG